ncbi:GHKL domain-containing protein [Ruminococcus sp.]|uniref:GHKL domain-containing protein n=1 Tax=Ruminococcus sp. TaxID=41978 RepID=UPI003AB46988
MLRLTDPEGGFLSSKRKGKGIGTESVKNIAAKYNGVAKFEYGDGMFYASVMLNI